MRNPKIEQLSTDCGESRDERERVWRWGMEGLHSKTVVRKHFWQSLEDKGQQSSQSWGRAHQKEEMVWGQRGLGPFEEERIDQFEEEKGGQHVWSVESKGVVGGEVGRLISWGARRPRFHSMCMGNLWEALNWEFYVRQIALAAWWRKDCRKIH